MFRKRQHEGGAEEEDGDGEAALLHNEEGK